MSSENPAHESNPFKVPTSDDDVSGEVVEGLELTGPSSSLPSPNPDAIDEQPPGRLHPLSLVFDVLSHVRTLVIPAVYGVFSAAKGNLGGLIIAGMIFVPTLVFSIIRYVSLRYSIRDSKLVVTEGIFFRRIRTVPIERIQNIDLTQNVLHRLFKVAEIRIETASGTEAEATLRVLSMTKVEKLRESVFHSKQAIPSPSIVESDGPNDNQRDDTPSVRTETLLTIPSNLLIRAGLASNKGTLLLGVLIGIYFQFAETLESYFNLEQFLSLLTQQSSAPMIVFLTVVAVLFIFVLFRLLGISWYLLRFSGYKLTRTGEDLRIQCGLMTRVSATVPRKRIQFISIHRNLLMRWMKLASIRIETAGGAGRGKEDAAKTVSSRWFIPVLPEQRVKELIENLRPGLTWDEEEFDWKPISPEASTRLSRLAVVASIAIGIAGFVFTRPWGWLFGAVALPLLILLAIKKTQSKRYARTDKCVVYRSGIFTKKTSLTFFEKIQSVRVDQSPFDRRWKMATLCVDTAAAGPADHQIHIALLTSEFAYEEFDEIVKQASGQLPVFG